LKPQEMKAVIDNRSAIHHRHQRPLRCRKRNATALAARLGLLFNNTSNPVLQPQNLT
jgi:hypothetical protein